jgi:hypothetical protein
VVDREISSSARIRSQIARKKFRQRNQRVSILEFERPDRGAHTLVPVRSPINKILEFLIAAIFVIFGVLWIHQQSERPHLSRHLLTRVVL